MKAAWQRIASAQEIVTQCTQTKAWSVPGAGWRISWPFGCCEA